MTDALAITGMLQSFKAISDITKALLNLRDTKMIRAKVIELNGAILSAQASALAANADQLLLLERKRELEKELANLKAWNAEKQKYQLTQVRPQGASGGNAFVYALKKNVGSTEPDHSICPNCYEDGKKSVLQSVSLSSGHVVILSCHRCNLKINLTGIEYGTQTISGAPLRHRSK